MMFKLKTQQGNHMILSVKSLGTINKGIKLMILLCVVTALTEVSVHLSQLRIKESHSVIFFH